MMVEVNSWPYDFPASEDFPKSCHRGNVRGKLLVRDRYIDNDDITTNGAYVGLAPPGDVGSWKKECKKQLDFTLKVIGGDLSALPGVSEAIEICAPDGAEVNVAMTSTSPCNDIELM